MNQLNKVKQIKVLDGGFGSQISNRIDVSIDEDVLWSTRLLTTNKEEVVNTHLDFLCAGADVISTNTYQASIDGFVKYLNLNEEQSYNLIKEAVSLAKTAITTYNSKNHKADTSILLAGSVGPYGACLHDGSEYTGNYKDTVTSLTLREWHKPRISALVEGGVDLLALETQPCKKEAEVLLDIIKEYPNMKAWLSFNCKDAKSIAAGENFQATVKECYKMNPNQLVAVGANCVPPSFVNELFCNINENLKEHPIPLIVYPNSGELYSKDEGWFGIKECRPVESYINEWLDIGLTWIGGCCRMYPKDITKIKNAVENWQLKHPE